MSAILCRPQCVNEDGAFLCFETFFPVQWNERYAIFSFEINQESHFLLSEIDHVLQFYTESSFIQNMKCDYYIEDLSNDCFFKPSLQILVRYF